MAPPTTHLLALLTRFCYDDAVAPNEHRREDLLDVLMKDSMFAVTACLDALHEALIPDHKDKRASFPDTEPDIKHAMEALKAFGLLCNICGGDSAISDFLIARWPSALAWIRFFDPCKRHLRPCSVALYARPADAIAQALSGYVQLLYNKGILDNERVSFKTLLRFWKDFPCHFPMTAGVGEEPKEADILFRGRDAAMTELLLRVLTAPDPNARAAAAQAILAEGHGDAKPFMCAAAKRMTLSQGFAYIPRERYVHDFPRLEDHIVLRYRYAEVCVALVELAPLHDFLSSREAAMDVINAFHFFSMVSFDRAAALKVCQVLAVLCEASFRACEAALRRGVLVALHRFLTPRAGDIIQIRLNKGRNDLAPVRMLAGALTSALVTRPVLKAFGEAVAKYNVVDWEIPPSRIWYRLMIRFARRQLNMDAFRRTLICTLCHEEGARFCCADTYYCSAVCQAADRQRHRPYCNGPAKGVAPPKLEIFGLGTRDEKFVVYAAHCEMQRKGQIWRTISAFLERPTVVKSGRDVHARLDFRAPNVSVTLCLSTGALREADPDEDDDDPENDENKENSPPTKTVLAITHQTAKATPRVIVDAVFDRSQSIVVPVGMYRFSFFAPTQEFEPKPKLEPKSKVEHKPKFAPKPKLELMHKPKPTLKLEHQATHKQKPTETSMALMTTVIEFIDTGKLSDPSVLCSDEFFVCETSGSEPPRILTGLRNAFALRRN
uniref:MYND-type domain-containing protein n=1 Tax=Schizophyllum commune (strain H4-8 / FGSC 9210) TaxID=578458 RepID=D8QKF4_SCHCM